MLTNGKVLIAGGANYLDATNSAELFNQGTDNTL